MSLLRALKQRNFALLWIGQTTSRLGDSLYRIALSWWVLEETQSAEIMSLVLIFSFTPMLIFLLIGGVAADRFPRIRLMLTSDLLRGVLVSGIALLAAFHQLEVWHVLAASLIFGFVEAFFQPAYVSIVPEITSQETLNSANALGNLSVQVSGILGPALGAVLVKLGGATLAFGLDALSFFIASGCLIPLLKLPQAQTSKSLTSSSSILSELRQGLSTVFTTPWLWITIILLALINVTMSAPMTIALPFLVKQSLDADIGNLGLIYSTVAVGSIMAALVLGRFTRIRYRGILSYGATLLSGAMIFLFGLPITLSGITVAAFVYGISVAIFGLIWVNTLQEFVPQDRLGRVASVDQFCSFVLLPVGYGLIGRSTDVLSPSIVFMVGGLSTMALEQFS